MENSISEKIEELMVCLDADNYHKGERFNGYDVYVPDYKRFAYRGLPYVVLVKDSEVRISSANEAIDYLNRTSTNTKGKRIK